MINVNELIPDFNQADAQAEIETYPYEELQFQRGFPLLYQPTLTWKALEASFNAKVMASVVAFNSRSPRFGRPLPSKISGDIPKVEGAREKVETDFNTLRALQDSVSRLPEGPTRRQAMQRILDWHYEDGPFVVNAVNARLEWMSKQILSKGGYSLTLINNEQGVQTTTEVGFEIPTSQIVNAAKDWSDPTADILADIKNRKAAAKLRNRRLLFMTMEEDTFNNMASNAGIQKFCATYVVNALGLQQEPDLDTLNRALARKGLPTIIVWESDVVVEDKAGEQETVSGWEPGHVTFTESNVYGDTQYTESADEYVQAGVATKTKSGIVLVKTWGLEDPITVVTKGVAYATPVLNNSKNVHILKTKLAEG